MILPRFEPRAVLATIARERITHVVFVPTMLAMLLDARGEDLSSLRHPAVQRLADLARLQRRVLERFDCDVAQFYGMTEAAPTVSHLSPADHRRGPTGSARWARRWPACRSRSATRSPESASCGSAART